MYYIIAFSHSPLIGFILVLLEECLDTHALNDTQIWIYTA